MFHLPSSARSKFFLTPRRSLLVVGVFFAPVLLRAQGSAALGNGLSAPATARGGAVVAEHGSPLDAVQGNPAGLAGLQGPMLDGSFLGMIAGGTFRNIANPDARLSGRAAALPYGAFATPLGRGPWTVSAAFTPDVLMRANWHYVDAPGTAGVSYGYQRQETQIIAVRSSMSAARTLGPHFAAGVTLGVSYNENELHAPYIFQQQPALQGLKVLLNLSTHGYGWNGAAGVQWQPTSRLRTGLAWKSGTTIHTTGTATGTASALFTALNVTADPTYRYQAAVLNHLPQAVGAGVSWQTSRHVSVDLEGDFIAWGQAFQQLPVNLSGGTNATINSVVGSSAFRDVVPLHWSNQGAFHGGVTLPVRESVALRAGYTYTSDPVPSATLSPLTAAIMQHAVATGVSFSHGRWQYAAAYQAQLPATQSVGTSGLLAGEYSNSRDRVWTQSVVLSARVSFGSHAILRHP